MGKKKNVSMTHEEIWDDSALVQSWDDAVEEYQLYHSIHAKGENVEDVLKAAESSSVAEPEVVGEAEIHAEEDAVNPESEDVAMIIDEGTSEPITQGLLPQPVSTSTTEVPAATLPMPHPVMANGMSEFETHGDRMLILPVKDEALKNLMMSWYYAGYYTGLHEGQQQASQGKSS
ncbi:unnamed protein product [Penicillium salamii]|uniref:Survival Motor Neuron Gemin2-binding domain-containing protein n=1 Tax=Penicillium salamii TaxID=1612424 RepID=A0A9W4JIH0_9EURO|nr:unnamed protein product [Penicillium salamii]CAG8103775.1 unnamed protein product [Penicillium salamii]CAG8138004.1 unnamed protein product [Penicillium salamii]CAG8144522.1 unnamed protein product [Penicillium salamii]CAG8179691.1 unnamed protein product [Penicillium salamii]